MNEGQGRGLLKVAGGTTWETEMDQFSTWDEDEDARTIRRIRFGCTRTRDGTHNNQIMNEGQGRGLLKVAGGTTWETEMDQFSKDMAVALGAADGMGRLF
jgi:hypothetical protein